MSAVFSRLFAALKPLAFLSVAGCVSFPPAPEAIAPPALAANRVQTADGTLLALQSWPAEDPQAVLIALHGMNDYAHFIDMAAQWWAGETAITTYAYDQRGFGRSPLRGRWAGTPTLKADLKSVLDAVRDRHPDTPIYVLGHSMGAGVALGLAADGELNADGLILAAPAVWGGDALPFPYRLAANIGAGLAPGKTLTGERTDRQATDNLEALRAMSVDPLVIKATRLDAILGVTRLMGEARAGAERTCVDTLFLIGEKDEIIPVRLQIDVARRLCGETAIRRYEEGWHLLLRDLQRENVWRDIADWIDARG